MAMYRYSQVMHISMYWALGTGKLISNSGFFHCLFLPAERQAHGLLVTKRNITQQNRQCTVHDCMCPIWASSNHVIEMGL
jgi:hypothetical protein